MPQNVCNRQFLNSYIYFHLQAKSRAEYGEEKKIARLISDMDEFISIIPKYLGDDIMHKEEKSSRASRLQGRKLMRCSYCQELGQAGA